MPDMLIQNFIQLAVRREGPASHHISIEQTQAITAFPRGSPSLLPAFVRQARTGAPVGPEEGRGPAWSARSTGSTVTASWQSKSSATAKLEGKVLAVGAPASKNGTAHAVVRVSRTVTYMEDRAALEAFTAA